MSAAAESEAMMFCASCGIAEVDDIKLKDCDDCDLVRYCTEECKKNHRPTHEEECKSRAAELHDEILFKQPESSFLGDCPICCLPLSFDLEKSVVNSCCSKPICRGCSLANKKRENEMRLQQSCPFCRKALPKTREEHNEQRMKRVEANDPLAVCEIGTEKYEKGDYEAAFEYFTKAVTLGDVKAHHNLSIMYHYGQGVEKDKKKELHHLTEAAIGGMPLARFILGYFEYKNGMLDRAAKHYIIAANLGHDEALDEVKNLYKDGFVSKEDFAAALRGHHAAIKATRSPQREEAAAFYNL